MHGHGSVAAALEPVDDQTGCVVNGDGTARQHIERVRVDAATGATQHNGAGRFNRHVLRIHHAVDGDAAMG